MAFQGSQAGLEIQLCRRTYRLDGRAQDAEYCRQVFEMRILQQRDKRLQPPDLHGMAAGFPASPPACEKQFRFFPAQAGQSIGQERCADFLVGGLVEPVRQECQGGYGLV